MMIFNEGKILLFYDEADRIIEFPKLSFLQTEKNPAICREFADDVRAEDYIYLFSVDDEKYFLAGTDNSFLTNDFSSFTGNGHGYRFCTLREIRAFDTVSKDKVFAAYTAYHLWKWYTDNRFCGKCGGKLVLDGRILSQNEHLTSSDAANTEPDSALPERALVCPACKNKIYPRINPAVIVAVTKGDKIILTKYRRGYAHNALIAGFTEIGETLEETVAREVMEEVGLKVRNILYYKSQPWGMALDILTGFICEADGDDTIRMDTGELKYAEWVSREDVELQPSDYSLTNEMMKMFKEGKI